MEPSPIVNLTCRISEDKYKLFKKRLIDKNVSIQEWVTAQIEKELAKEPATG